MFGVQHQGPLANWRNVTYQSECPGKYSTVANVGVMDNPRFRQEFDCVLSTAKRIVTFAHEYAGANGYDNHIADAISQLNAEKAARDAEAMKKVAEAATAAGAKQASKVAEAADVAVSKVAEAADAAVSKVAEAADAAASKVAEAADAAAAAARAGLKRTRDSGVGSRGGAAKRARGRPRKGA
jgi:hypothetical protein